MYRGRSYHSTASGPYDLLPAGQPNGACTCASATPSSACVLRWTPRMAADVGVGHLLLTEVVDPALVAIPTLACNIF